MPSSSTSSSSTWRPHPHATPEDVDLASSLSIWPLDSSNADLLNEVRHREYVNPIPHHPAEDGGGGGGGCYDLAVIGAGAGGLVSSRQVRTFVRPSLLLPASLPACPSPPSHFDVDIWTLKHSH